MALLQNTVLNASWPGLRLGGIETTPMLAGQFRPAGRDWFMGWHAPDKTSGASDGCLAPAAWRLPLKPGGMSGRNSVFVSVTSSGQGVMGLPVEGLASFSVTVDDLIGELLALGGGTASLILTTNNPLLTAVVNGAGSATFTVLFNSPVLGALADASGSAAIVFSVAPVSALPEDSASPLREGLASFSISISPVVVYPLNDTSPLREGNAGLTVTGTLTPYALGHLGGSTVDATSMTPTAVAQAVWSALAGQFNDSGTMGEALNGAGAAGNPWLADLNGYTQEQAGGVVKIILALLQNKQVTDPATGKLTVYDVDGITPLFEADLFEDAAGTVPYRGQGAENRGKLT